jgi:putative nucleotidyltransferase with HDIG domain
MGKIINRLKQDLKEMYELPIKLKFYLITVFILTFFSLRFFIKMDYNYSQLSNYVFIVFFGCLMALTEMSAVIFRDISFSTSFAVTIAAFILHGPLVAVIVVVIGYSFRIVKVDGEYAHILNTPIYVNLFNYCVYILSVVYGNYTFVHIGGIHGAQISKLILPLCGFSITVFLVNILFMGILFSIINRRNIFYYLISNIRLGILNFFAMAPLGVLATLVYNGASYGGLILYVFPVVLARFTFSQYIEAKSKYIQTVTVIMHALEARDKYTEGHSKRVAELACVIARELKFNEWKIEDLNAASLLHDVGKLGIDDNILNKPDTLTTEEYDIIKKHPEIGFKILTDIKNIEYVKAIVKHHHERYDGKGYPDGKKADEISLDIYIVQLADSIDAMSTDRPYRKALQPKEIIEEINKNTGTQFHPTVVEAYFRSLKNQRTMEVRLQP